MGVGGCFGECFSHGDDGEDGERALRRERRSVSEVPTAESHTNSNSNSAEIQ